MEEPEHDGQEPDEESESSASDEIAYAVADLLRSQQLLDALKGWVAARTFPRKLDSTVILQRCC